MTAPPKRSLPNRAWQLVVRFVSTVTAVMVCRMRWFGNQKVPGTGGALVLSNHQSNLDPVLIGLACPRRMNYLARTTLFRSPIFRWMVAALDAIPIDREGGGLEGLKETLRRIKRGELVLIFPEGTRTPDGEVKRIMPGFCAVARRAGVPLVPVALDGAYDAWPRQRRFPRPAVIHVQWGDPILPSQIEKLTDEQLVEEVERRIRSCHAACRRSRRRLAGLGRVD
jgi:1-acyl-sn-glycerol-3-phosphate acyltransferase